MPAVPGPLAPPPPAARPRTRQLAGGHQLCQRVVLQHSIQGDDEVLGDAQRDVARLQRLCRHSDVNLRPLPHHRLQLHLLLGGARLLRQQQRRADGLEGRPGGGSGGGSGWRERRAAANWAAACYTVSHCIILEGRSTVICVGGVAWATPARRRHGAAASCRKPWRGCCGAQEDFGSAAARMESGMAGIGLESLPAPQTPGWAAKVGL